MKKFIILSISLWLSNNYNSQTKWIAHKSHSGKMNTFSMRFPDNLGCQRGNFLELSISNFDVLGNECTRPIILENGMVIKDPKLDSAGFADSHKEVNRLAKLDSINYSPYKVVYDSIKNANFTNIKIIKQKTIEPIENKQESIYIDNTTKIKTLSKKKKDTPTPIIKTKHISPTAPIKKIKEPSSKTKVKKIQKTSLPILPIIISIFGILTFSIIRKILLQKNQ